MIAIALTQGKIALVDDEDWPILSRWPWHARLSRGGWYAATHLDQNIVYLHRLIAGATDKREVDHINGNTLDCRKENLRPVTRSENAQNQHRAHRDSTTGVRNVSFIRASGKYRVALQVNGRGIFLGEYSAIADAERAAIEGRRRYMTHAPENQGPAQLVAEQAL